MGLSTVPRSWRSDFVTEERNYSEKTSEAIDEETRRISDQLYHRARTVLTNRMAELKRIAEALIEKETLDRQQIEQLLSGPPGQKAAQSTTKNCGSQNTEPAMSEELKNKTALITGAAKRIGRETALTLADRALPSLSI